MSSNIPYSEFSRIRNKVFNIVSNPGNTNVSDNLILSGGNTHLTVYGVDNISTRFYADGGLTDGRLGLVHFENTEVTANNNSFAKVSWNLGIEPVDSKNWTSAPSGSFHIDQQDIGPFVTFTPQRRMGVENVNPSETLDVNGNIKIAAGYGIKFGNSTTNATLSDYEEGTWTPSFGGTTTNPTVGYTTQVGTYTKIGNLITVAGFIKLSSVTSTGSGDLTILNLPVACDSAYPNYHSGPVSRYGSVGALPATAPAPYEYRVLTSGINSRLIIRYSYDLTVPTSVLGASSEIQFSITYKTT